MAQSYEFLFSISAPPPESFCYAQKAKGQAKISKLPKICDVLFLEESKCEISQLKNLGI